MVFSSPSNIPSSSVPVQKDVILRPQPSGSGRLSHSVSYTVSEETPDDIIPLLLDVPDDEDDDETNKLTDTMEEEFFGQTVQDEPAVEEKQCPVSICIHFFHVEC